MTESTRVLYYGRDHQLPEQHALRAGPLSLLFEAGDLRYVRFGEHEVIRRLYWALRDRNWGTPPIAISNLQLDRQDDAFAIRYDAQCQQHEIDFRAKVTITGNGEGELHFAMEGVAHSTFYRNRLGFCLLHPMAIAGARARITHVDGSIEEQRFPRHIAAQHIVNKEIKPVIPFNEMRGVAHEIMPGVWAEVSFRGEIFEMEDQRNWTDASYKTYCTPLRLPFPHEVKEGSKIAQSVSLRLVREGKQSQRPAASGKRATANKGVTVTIDSTQTSRLPAIGLGVASHQQALSQRELSRIQALNLSHLRVDLPLAQPGYLRSLRRATKEANALHLGLEVALHLSDNAAKELAKLRSQLDTLQPPVATWLIFHQREPTTSARWVELARASLTSYDHKVRFCGGTNIYFTDLNRDRPALESLDAVAYTINPQVHAFDNGSLIETLAAQAATATSARQFCADLPLFVTPITLQPRFNPNATGPEPAPKPGELPPQVDVRQMSLFGAGWTLGSIKQLAESGEVASLTYYETTGWRGVMESKEGSALPDTFQSQPSAVFPLYHILASVGEFAGGEVLRSESSQSLQVESLVLHKEGRMRVLLANVSGSSQQVSLSGLAGDHARLRTLDERNVARAARSPSQFLGGRGIQRALNQGKMRIELLPYALAFIDL